MKKILVTAGSILLLFANTRAQNIAIGTPVPEASAAFEIKASTKGLLMPRTSSSGRNAIANPAKGLMLYDSTLGSFWFHNGNAWGQLGAATNAWSLNGNTGTIAGNFIGTIDKRPLWFRVNNTPSGLVDTGTNTFLGYNTGSPAIGGSGITGIGNEALGNNTGDFNTATGAGALAANTTGSFNTASGSKALYVSNGIGNTAFGANALAANTGSYNTATGLNALKSNNTGGNNTATGVSALEFNSSGINNTAHGMYSLYSNKTGQQNTANGYTALYTNDNGSYNTAHGVAALNKNVGGSYNTANGAYALYSNSSGVANTAIGDSSLYSNSTGSNNTAMGSRALFKNTEGNYNTATGSYALNKNFDGNSNTANGYQALFSNKYAWDNVGAGKDALYYSLIGTGNTAIGVRTLVHITEACAFTCIGANHNTAIGLEALQASNEESSENVAIGHVALGSPEFIFSNTAIGSSAGNVNGVGSNNTFIGVNADLAAKSMSNATAIGSGAIAGASNKVRIGDANVTVVESAAGSWTISDGRFKNEIKEDIKGLGVIKLLRPVSYHFDATGFDEFLMQHFPDSIKAKRRIENKEAMTKVADSRQSGFLAQEVAEAFTQSGNHFSIVHAPENPTDNWSMSYEKLVVPLVKAMQEQQQRIESLKKENARLAAGQAQLKKMQTEIELLKVALLKQNE
jgi:hypothetical protein